MKQYKLVVDSLRRCEQKVNRLLDDGWELYGPPSMAKQPGVEPEIIQALIKTKDD